MTATTSVLTAVDLTSVDGLARKDPRHFKPNWGRSPMLRECKLLLQTQSSAAASVLPLTMAEPPVCAVTIETGPQDIWWRIEDILARLALHCGITVERADRRGGEPLITVHGLKQMTQPELIDVRRAALNADSYRCWRDGRPLAFVQTLDWLGDDLVLSLTPLAVLERWDEGPDVVWQVHSFMARLERQPLLPRGA